MYCWICSNDLSNNYHLLPDKYDDIERTKYKDYKIVEIVNMTFIYHMVCPDCLIVYLDNYPVNFRKLRRREIGK